MDNRMSFLLERYKYVLAEKQKLNSNTFKIVSIYQAGLALLITGEFGIFATFGDGKLTRPLALRGILALIILDSLLSFFSLLFLCSGISGWLGYRLDEAEIEAEIFGSARPRPTLNDALSWYETYIIIAILVFYFVFISVNMIVMTKPSMF